ncbi:unnamed protein product [Moneuplotes crassus]|uniref:Uncharacterized protein n=1 Tax=Euplotes crassus TaxID=5936 RepID=A0AAD1XPR9_EUPCR|nr:unnamed protein product [Moneuplotes crassus]
MAVYRNRGRNFDNHSIAGVRYSKDTLHHVIESNRYLNNYSQSFELSSESNEGYKNFNYNKIKLPFACKKYSVPDHTVKFIKNLKKKRLRSKLVKNLCKKTGPQDQQIREILHKYDPRLTKHENFLISVDAKLSLAKLPKLVSKKPKKMKNLKFGHINKHLRQSKIKKLHECLNLTKIKKGKLDKSSLWDRYFNDKTLEYNPYSQLNYSTILPSSSIQPDALINPRNPPRTSLDFEI